MLPIERRQKIMDLLTEQKVLKVQDLMNLFNMSLETVRRDLNHLEKQNQIQKIYGGIKLLEPTSKDHSMTYHMSTYHIAKDTIAQKCSELVKAEDCIFIDSGSTTSHLAKYIKEILPLTVITNSLLVANELIDTDITLFLIGGKVNQENQSIITSDSLFQFEQLNITKAFISVGGISLSNGLSDTDLEVIMMRRKIIERSSKVYVATDSSKFEKDATINIAPLSKVTAIITNHTLNETIQMQYREEEIKLILA